MGALNEACKAAGGRVRGVCHKMFVDGPITALFQGLELIQTEGDGLTERKRGLAEGADCFIALPVHALPASVHMSNAPSLSRASALRSGRAGHMGRAVGGGVRAAARRGARGASVPRQHKRVRYTRPPPTTTHTHGLQPTDLTLPPTASTPPVARPSLRPGSLDPWIPGTQVLRRLRDAAGACARGSNAAPAARGFFIHLCGAARGAVLVRGACRRADHCCL